MNCTIALVTLLLALCTCTPVYTSQSEQDQKMEAPQRASATDLYEVVLRYQIRSWKIAADSYCVEVNGKDADRELLQRLKPLAVKAASACHEEPSRGYRVLDIETGKTSVIFDVGEIRWRTHSQVEVDGGYLCGSLCSASGFYQLAWDGRHWAVTKFRIRFQS